MAALSEGVSVAAHSDGEAGCGSDENKAASWADVVDTVVARGQDLIKDRGFLFAKHLKCMTGEGFVQFLVYERIRGATTKGTALELAQSMLDAGALLCVNDKGAGKFTPSAKAFYRLVALERTQCACGVAAHWRAL